MSSIMLLILVEKITKADGCPREFYEIVKEI